MRSLHILLLFALGLPFLGSPLVAFAGRRLGPRVGWLALVFPLISTAALLGLAGSVDLADRTVIEWPWIPSLGLNLSFLVDGLSILFGLIVSGMGCLIFLYAIFYFARDSKQLGRFYCYLVLFMSSMLGTVFANHLILLFVFWELTSLSSFLLIGFLHEEEGSRTGARQAFLVTSGTGLLLFAGAVVLQQAAGTATVSELLARDLPWAQQPRALTLAMVLLFVGAFGKSAQFPFHFWLPSAMAAPTPVSAYLHSATMVKLGVFLVARIYPLFVGHDGWLPLLVTIGFATMVLGALLALLSHDLKAILAYSTVGQLGFLIGYYGLGPAQGVTHDHLHILNHVLYKGGLFMIVGVVAHASGVRDIRALGGLWRRLPFLGLITLIAAASMAGLPGTTGFVSKEAMLKDLLEAMRTHGAFGVYAAACALVASLAQVAFSARLFAKVFLGPMPEPVRHHFHAPSLAMQVPPALLAAGALVFGLFPGMLDGVFAKLAVRGLRRPQHLALWHGFTPELAISATVIGLGLAFFWWGEKTHWRWHIPRWLRLDLAFEAGIEAFSKFAKTLTRVLRSDQPTDYLPIIITFFALLAGGALLANLGALPSGLSPSWGPIEPLRMSTAVLIALSVLGVLLLRRWTAQLISLSAAGFLICFFFVLYQAPDLALTQILVETVTLILVLLLLARFSRAAQEGEERRKPTRLRRALHVLLALGVGTLMTALVSVVTAKRHPDPIGLHHLESTINLAKGSNAVNTILVDFRGFDTLGEISVLVIATLGCLGLLMRYKRTPEEYRQGPFGPPGFGTGERRP